MSRATEPLSIAQAEQLSEAFLDLWLTMPADWVFAGVLLRADFEYNPHVEDGPWRAIATKTNNTTLGPIPEVHGYGQDIIEAVVDLRRALAASVHE